ncbi:dihydrouridine synthase [Reticulomyxa filosa]|uniref:tRNA-dihydrouridine(16/17) synthase [NAD(P)(+)] n=1 Tax=Reticulomyxa filosa TaxID=46433 RepID=X6NXW4_RETFI|nr:dihydrouridine synthase [Reticulomyxa filosa]|eukprot:ETO30723.1 dihydrouridine synthase [Reticulomyxa filosa]
MTTLETTGTSTQLQKTSSSPDGYTFFKKLGSPKNEEKIFHSWSPFYVYVFFCTENSSFAPQWLNKGNVLQKIFCFVLLHAMLHLRILLFELPFRMLCRKYGVPLCYTPMIHAKCFVEVKPYKKDVFIDISCLEDRPLVAQFCANDPQVLLKAAKMLEDKVDAIDINFGCPQNIARRGHYGAFLMDDISLMERLINICHKNLKIPVSAKIRVFADQEKSKIYFFDLHFHYRRD